MNSSDDSIGLTAVAVDCSEPDCCQWQKQGGGGDAVTRSIANEYELDDYVTNGMVARASKSVIWLKRAYANRRFVSLVHMHN